MFNIYFDIAAIAVYASLIFATIYRKNHTTGSGRFFLVMQIVALLAGVFDIISVSPQMGMIGMIIGNYGYLATRNLTAVVFCGYQIAISDGWHKLRKKPILIVLLMLPYLAIVGLLIANGFTNWIFYIDGTEYVRGPYILLLYALCAFYLVVGLAYVIIYRSFFNADKMFALLVLYPLSLVSISIQFIWNHLLIELLATAIASFFILIMVERPEEAFETEIGLKKYSAFATDLKKAQRTKKKLAIIFIRIVNSEVINGKLSYDEQVQIKRGIADIIRNTVQDFFLRGNYYWLGDGRFAAVLDEEFKEQSRSYAQTLKRRLNMPLKTTYGMVDLYSNVSLIQYPEDINSYEVVLAFASQFYHMEGVMDEVFEISSIPNRKEFDMKLHIGEIIRQAVTFNRFEIYYQPIYSVNDKKIYSAEALLRLNDPTYGIVPPDIFIPEAENTGAIHKISDIVFEEVCSFISSEDFKKSGLEHIEINISTAQCVHEDLPKRIRAILNEHNVDPKYIHFDIQESSDAYSHKMMEENIKTIKELGIHFALDDYGAGYSNINTVSSLPLDVVKIDKTFADSIEKPEMKVVMEYYIKMIKELNRKVVIEGIETKEMLKLYENFLCDYIQGYYFSKPLKKSELVKYINEFDFIPDLEEAEDKKEEETPMEES